MIKECIALGLKVFESEGVTYLKKTNKKYSAIFAAHVVEHISYSHMIDLVNKAYGRLVMGGKLILETPNPTTVATHIGGFYSDPTHLHFVHPQLLKFVAEQAGFKKVDIMFGSEQSDRLIDESIMSDLEKKNIDRLNQVIFGYQDYSIIAEK
jgi:O-antigen chain-terminating methyltransferase